MSGHTLRAAVDKCLCQESTGGLYHELGTKSLLSQQNKIEALVDKTYTNEIKLHAVVTCSLVMATNVMQVQAATIFRIQVGVFSGGLGLKILVARRQRGPTHNYKAII
jgi:hypothetical protein